MHMHKIWTFLVYFGCTDGIILFRDWKLCIAFVPILLYSTVFGLHKSRLGCSGLTGIEHKRIKLELIFLTIKTSNIFQTIIWKFQTATLRMSKVQPTMNRKILIKVEIRCFVKKK